jgi:hypothetical protein
MGCFASVGCRRAALGRQGVPWRGPGMCAPAPAPWGAPPPTPPRLCRPQKLEDHAGAGFAAPGRPLDPRSSGGGDAGVAAAVAQAGAPWGSAANGTPALAVAPAHGSARSSHATNLSGASLGSSGGGRGASGGGAGSGGGAAWPPAAAAPSPKGAAHVPFSEPPAAAVAGRVPSTDAVIAPIQRPRTAEGAAPRPGAPPGEQQQAAAVAAVAADEPLRLPLQEAATAAAATPPQLRVRGSPATTDAGGAGAALGRLPSSSGSHHSGSGAAAPRTAPPAAVAPGAGAAPLLPAPAPAPTLRGSGNVQLLRPGARGAKLRERRGGVSSSFTELQGQLTTDVGVLSIVSTRVRAQRRRRPGRRGEGGRLST